MLSRRVLQWVIDGTLSGDKKEVKAKSLKALEKLGHRDLKLDEYESTRPTYYMHRCMLTCRQSK